jgi:hypothetical protein
VDRADDEDALLAGQALQEGDDLATRGTVKAARRLVED